MAGVNSTGRLLSGAGGYWLTGFVYSLSRRLCVKNVKKKEKERKNWHRRRHNLDAQTLKQRALASAGGSRIPLSAYNLCRAERTA